MLHSRTMMDVGVVAVPLSAFWSVLSLRSTVSSQDTVSFLSKSLHTTSTSQASSECRPRRRKRPLSERAALVTILRRRRRILSRSSSESTSGPSKSLATRRKPPRGKRVIFRFQNVSSTPIPWGARAEQTHKKDKDQRRNIRNSKIFVVHAIERSSCRNSHRNGCR